MKLAAVRLCMVAISTAAYADGPPAANIGNTYEIRRQYETSETDSEGGSGTSSGHDTITERGVATRTGGVELEYDLPRTTKAEDRARQWQFPARVFKLSSGPWQLLNDAELVARRDRWLKRAKLPNSACGHWYFTWNAFRIECDPNDVLKLIAGFNPWPDLMTAGAAYRDSSALAPVRMSQGDTPTTLVAVLAVDPATIRRDRAQADVVAAEIVHRKQIALDAAIAARAGEDIAGTITVTIEPEGENGVTRLTKQTNLTIRTQSGKIETRNVTETWERQLIPQAKL